VVLSPDGTQLAYGAYDEARLQQVFVINTDGTGKKQLTEDPNKKWELAWGKDKIAYVSYGKDGLEKIFVVNPDGTGNAQLIPDNTRQGNAGSDKPPAWAAPSWSPDGKSLVYTSLDEQANPKMYRVIRTVQERVWYMTLNSGSGARYSAWTAINLYMYLILINLKKSFSYWKEMSAGR